MGRKFCTEKFFLALFLWGGGLDHTSSSHYFMAAGSFPPLPLGSYAVSFLEYLVSVTKIGPRGKGKGSQKKKKKKKTFDETKMMRRDNSRTDKLDEKQRRHNHISSSCRETAFHYFMQFFAYHPKGTICSIGAFFKNMLVFILLHFFLCIIIIIMY